MKTNHALLALALGISGVSWGFKRPRRREERTMKAPHVYPPNPFESRQVRRARERQEAQTRGDGNG